jgi:tol-pal system protein YbgF
MDLAMTPRHVLTTLSALAVMAVASIASAQDTRALMDRIDRLQRDVDVLQRRAATGGSGAPVTGGAVITPGDGFVGQTEARFSSLEAQSREQTGRLEEIQFKLRQLETRIERLVGDIEFRFSQLERGGGAAPAQLGQSTATPPAAAVGQFGAGGGGSSGAAAPTAPSGAGHRLVLVPSGTSSQALEQRQAAARAATPAQGGAQQAAVTPAQPVTLPPGSPEAQYEFAYGVLLQAQRDQTDFGSAEQAMRAFVTQHPNHRLAGNAQYWLGETYYVRRDYQNAAIAFGEGLKKYPSADKAPDNMLRFGMSLAQLNRKPDACATFGELGKRYPAASSNVKQGAQRERQRLGC